MRICIFDVKPFEKGTLEAIRSERPELDLVLVEEGLNKDSLHMAEGADGVSVLGTSKVNAEILKALKEMGISHVSTRTIGFDHIDVKCAGELGISTYNAFYNPNNVADFTVMMMLIMLRKAKVSICRALVNDFSLDGLQGREMHNLTVGIIGTGKIGVAVIKNLSGFGCRILAYDLYQNQAVKDYAEYVSLDELYASSDIVSLHIPLTEDNYHMIDKDTIHKMKKGVIIINTARGQLIDTEDLIEALEEEYVGGAGIDALEEEAGMMHVDIGTRVVDNRSLFYLKQFPNVLYTQHYAFYTEEATQSMVRCGVDSILAGLKGESTPCLIK